MRTLLCLICVLALLLSGCASTLRSEVTAFHQWPSAPEEKTFGFAVPATPASLERQSYEGLIRAELLKLGLTEVSAGESPAITVSFDAEISARDVRVIETVLVDAWSGAPWVGYGYYGHPHWGWPGYGHPLYGPMWPSMPVARDQERRYTVFSRQLKIKLLESAAQRPLYEVTVRSEGREGNLAKLMPYLVESAFAGFPGKSGEPRMIELKMRR